MPVCTWPETISTTSRPLVTYQGLFGSPPGFVTSMRALSKYCTVRWPPGAWANGSLRISSGVGPQVQDRVASLSATGQSARDQTRKNASVACAGGANAGANSGPARGTAGGTAGTPVAGA